MKNDNFKYQLIATQALDKKYGFCPAAEQVKLLESDGEGTYILFRVGEHEYRCEDGEITNMEERKKIEEAVSLYFGMFQEARKDLDELKEAQKKQEKQFVTKELMLTEAYNEKRMGIENLKGDMRFIKSLADDRKKEIERLEGKLGELKKTLHYREMDLEKASKKREELETKIKEKLTEAR